MEILYDTLLYIAFTQNEKNMTSRIYAPSEYIDEDMKLYCELKRTVPTPPDILEPLCYCTPTSEGCFLMTLLARWPSHASNPVNFCTRLCRDTNLLSDFIECTFSGISGTEKSILLSQDAYSIYSVYTKLFAEYRLPVEMMDKFIVLTSAFDRVINEVSRAIVNIYPYLAELHEVNSALKRQTIMSVQENRVAIDRAYKLSPVIPMSVYVSLLSPWSNCNMQVGEEYWYIAGVKYLESIHRERGTFENFNRLMSSKTSWHIVLELIEDSICANDIVRKYAHNVSSVHNAINTLQTNGVIEVSHRKGRERYYRLNPRYLASYGEEIMMIKNKIEERSREHHE